MQTSIMLGSIMLRCIVFAPIDADDVVDALG
jgi:hypothetical protein